MSSYVVNFYGDDFTAPLAPRLTIKTQRFESNLGPVCVSQRLRLNCNTGLTVSLLLLLLQTLSDIIHNHLTQSQLPATTTVNVFNSLRACNQFTAKL